MRLRSSKFYRVKQNESDIRKICIVDVIKMYEVSVSLKQDVYY